jgi:hypothetical protein
MIATNDQENLILVRPICETLGIDYSSQMQKIKENEDWNSVAVLSTTTESDGTEYETLCLPLEFVSGWLFTINPMDVEPEQEFVLAYLMQCCHALCEEYSQRETNIKHSSFSVEEGGES